MPLSRRYTPEHPPGESCLFGMDYSFVLPPGVGIASGTLDIQRNTNPPVEAVNDWSMGQILNRGRALYCRLQGGVEGVDYQLRWTAYDTQGNTWPRTALILCAQTS
jgi:hypothetical protein